MIDTDKYEGHIAGPWVYEEDNPHNLRGAWEATVLIPAPSNDTKEYPNGRPHPVLSAAYDLYHLDRADLKLIADAPLLLEEVKRLREQLGRYTQFVLWVEEEHNEVFDEYEGKNEL